MNLIYNLKCLHLSVTQPEEKQGPTIELKRNLEIATDTLSFVHIKYFWLFVFFVVFMILNLCLLKLKFHRCALFCNVVAIIFFILWFLIKPTPLKDLEKPMTLKESEKVSDFICINKNLFWWIDFCVWPLTVGVFASLLLVITLVLTPVCVCCVFCVVCSAIIYMLMYVVSFTSVFIVFSLIVAGILTKKPLGLFVKEKNIANKNMISS